MSPRKQDIEVMYGTLDLMILKTLSWGPRHGLAILLWINEVTGNRLVIEEGALYPALHRMERKGWLDAEWGVSDKGRQAKFYHLTAGGRSALTAQMNRWSEYTRVVDLVLRARVT
ncbi:MAG: PadR family transcriptional regulator [Gemmatimonadaceae bacterium]